jgi:hypothetical protein
MKVEFSRQIFEKTQIWNLMKIRLVGDKMLHADGRTDGRDEASRRSSPFCERA